MVNIEDITFDLTLSMLFGEQIGKDKFLHTFTTKVTRVKKNKEGFAEIEIIKYRTREKSFIYYNPHKNKYLHSSGKAFFFKKFDAEKDSVEETMTIIR